MPGRLLVGTSGFSYPAWSPRFYPPGLKGDELLRSYAARLPAVELNNTFYQQPKPAKVDAWLAATPPEFRFVVKAQRGGSFRSFAGAPEPGLPWLTDPYRRFGDRLGAVLYRVPTNVHRDDDRLLKLLRAWPADLPLAVELQEADWHVDETFAALAEHDAALVTTELPEDEAPPTIRRTGRFLYLRLRRHDYDRDGLRAWADRLAPFLADGLDVFVFFRHDEVGRGPELALDLADLAAAEVPG
jgi:uncharacterized protein YecE (DUF72 family)